MRKLHAILLTVLFSFFLSCEQMEFTEFFELGPLRILAVTADTPEIGESSNSTDVNMNLYISDIEAGGRNVSIDIAACVDPGVAFGEEPTCEGSDSLNTNLPDVPDIDTSTLARFTGLGAAFSVPVPGNLLDGLSETDKERGIDYLVTFVVSAGEESIEAYKRIHISTSNAPNQNPVLNAILVNGAPNTASLSEGDELDVTTDTPEDYVEIDFSGFSEELTEEYLVSWFAYGGQTSFSRTNPGATTEWEEAAEATNFDYLSVVLRDGRGGIAILNQEF